MTPGINHEVEYRIYEVGLHHHRIGLDLRLNHGGTLSNYTWDDVMRQIRALLSINPDEFVIMLIGSEVVSNDWSDEMKDAVSKYNYMYIETFDPLKVSVKDVRGKILLLKRQEECPCGNLLKFSDNTTFEYNDFMVEDYYKEYDTDMKFNKVKENLELANTTKRGKFFFITFNSIAYHNCKTPYEYAWGDGNNAMNKQLSAFLANNQGKNTWLRTSFHCARLQKLCNRKAMCRKDLIGSKVFLDILFSGFVPFLPQNGLEMPQQLLFYVILLYFL